MSESDDEGIEIDDELMLAGGHNFRSNAITAAAATTTMVTSAKFDGTVVVDNEQFVIQSPVAKEMHDDEFDREGFDKVSTEPVVPATEFNTRRILLKPAIVVGALALILVVGLSAGLTVKNRYTKNAAASLANNEEILDDCLEMKTMPFSESSPWPTYVPTSSPAINRSSNDSMHYSNDFGAANGFDTIPGDRRDLRGAIGSKLARKIFVERLQLMASKSTPSRVRQSFDNFSLLIKSGLHYAIGLLHVLLTPS